MNFSEIMKNAPRYLTLRYGSLNSYVWESLYPQTKKNRFLNKIEDEGNKKEEISRMKGIVDEATLLLFIFLTRKIFLEGSDAAKKAVDTFKDLGVNEFYLGNAKFSGRNENVVMGDKLAEKMFESLGYEMQHLIADSHYMSDILKMYQKYVS